MGDAKLAVSVITEAEVRSGLLILGAATLMDKYETSLRGRLHTFRIDDEIAETFAILKARQSQVGSIVGDLDLLIAACARTYGLVLATLNRRDFSRVEGLAWEDWGEAQ